MLGFITKIKTAIYCESLCSVISLTERKIQSEVITKQVRFTILPARPFIRGTAQNPDVYFQGRVHR